MLRIEYSRKWPRNSAFCHWLWIFYSTVPPCRLSSTEEVGGPPINVWHGKHRSPYWTGLIPYALMHTCNSVLAPRHRLPCFFGFSCLPSSRETRSAKAFNVLGPLRLTEIIANAMIASPSCCRYFIKSPSSPHQLIQITLPPSTSSLHWQ